MDVIVAPKSKALMVPYERRVQNLLPASKPYEWQDKRWLVVPHNDDVVAVLRNMGIKAPPTILHQYDWAGSKPFDVQRHTAALLTTTPRAYVLNAIGTGKTRAALYALDYLMKTGRVRKALIVAPLSTLTSVWENEAFQYFMHREYAIVYGHKKRRLKQLERDVDFYIINHDGVKVMEKELAARPDIDVVVIDELAVFRNHRTGRWKSLKAVLEGRRFAWGMTGSPTPGEPVDAWAQVRLLTPQRVTPFFRKFHSETMYQVTQFKWLPKREANDIVYEAMRPAVRFSRDDCLDLPDCMTETRTCPLSAEQATAYKDMLKHFRMQFKDGHVTAANEGVMLMKLLQICSGFAYGTEGKVYDLDCKARFDLLMDISQETDAKLIVFAPFVQAVEKVSRMLIDKLGEAYVATIHGQTSKSARDKAFRAFQHASMPRFLVAHPRTMQHGLTLTAANTVVWWTPESSLETYEQANGRITRPSQTRKQLIMHLESSPIERRIYKRLQDRATMQGVLLSMFEGVHVD